MFKDHRQACLNAVLKKNVVEVDKEETVKSTQQMSEERCNEDNSSIDSFAFFDFALKKQVSQEAQAARLPLLSQQRPGQAE